MAPAADKLLANKSNSKLLQPYDVRSAAVVAFLRAVRPGLAVETGALSDPQARCSDIQSTPLWHVFASGAAVVHDAAWSPGLWGSLTRHHRLPAIITVRFAWEVVESQT